MNLKLHLLLQIIVIATICLVVICSYVLFQVNKDVKQQATTTIEAAEKYLQVQISGINPNQHRTGRFPDFDLWKQTYPFSGVCLRYAPSTSIASPYTLCQGEARSMNKWPEAFEMFYKSIFSTAVELSRPVTFKGEIVGTISVTPSANMELFKAWDHIKSLLGLTASTIFAVCAWVYFAIHRALKPAQVIVNHLEQMQHDNPLTLPDFKLYEWQRIGSAINDFVAIQNQLLADRKRLVSQLMAVQEEERVFLARELHDELGQCLTGISALSASVIQAAQQSCPNIITEVESIAQINRRLMETVRYLLLRLRPAELEELGIEACLHAMIDEWNRQQQNRIVCHLSIHVDSLSLKPPLPIVLFRIVQEGLTNIAKHANATNAWIQLIAEDSNILLTIKDNGILDIFPLPHKGMGLLGIRDRVAGLGGIFELNRNEHRGLSLLIQLPQTVVERSKK